MNNNQFCHLHVHDQFSQLDGMGTAEQYVQKAKQMGFEYLALSNHGNGDGLIQFQKECDKNEIKPILGCELYIVQDVKSKDKASHMTVFVKNNEGWRNLLQILSYANLEGFYRRPRVDVNYFLEHCSGFVILTGCGNTFLTTDWGIDFLYELEKTIPDTWDLYFEVMPHDIEFQKNANKIALDLALEIIEGTQFVPPIVATNDCHYINEEDWEAQEVLLAIQRGAKWNDPNRWKFGIKGLYLKSADEMYDSFIKQGVLNREEIIDALENTLDVAKKCCDFRIEKQTISLPNVRGYKGAPDVLLKELCHKGERSVYLGSLFGDEYNKRFEEEYDLICEKNFTGYFCLVKELIDWCKENAILVGPGRGSVGGSLIAYLLGITQVDPIKFELLFSRFIAPDRIDFPDIDLDFEDTKRYLVRQHLEDMYGINNVANIATFLRMKGRGAIRDVCRVFDVPLKEVDEFAKIIDDSGEVRGNNRIEDAAQETNIGRKFAQKYPKIINLAQKLEGQIRGYGKHAAGIIVSAEDLTLGTRCNLIKRGNEGIAINWEMNDAEYVGLMKLDVLGLSTLTVLGECKRLIKENQGVDLQFEDIPLDDSKVYENLSIGNTIGTFQFSGHTCTEWIKKMGVEEFEHLVQLISIARPGPLDSGITDLFVRRKHGEQWTKKHPIFETLTAKTYGVVIYQEQVMEVINKVAGLPYATADKIRKIIGKKRDVKEFIPYRDAFIKGCLEQKTLTAKEAIDFWDELQSHAHYSFNRSHAVEYTMIGYWTEWLKLNYPKEFLCATLTCEPDSKKNELIKEAQRLGFNVMPTKSGISDAIKWIFHENILYAPFIAIKGLGEKKALEAVGLKRSVSMNSSGFFKIEQQKGKKKSQLETMLEEVGVFEPGIPKGVSQYFNFTISTDHRILYPNLFQLFPNIKPSQVVDVVAGRVRLLDVIKKIRFNNDSLIDCVDCELSKECSSPVMPSKGLYNIMIVGEAPGKNEDLEGKGFVGKAGEGILWPELGKYGLKRTKFHVTNIVKCYPSETKTPTKIHIQKCMSWLQEEMKAIDCRLILAFGNTAIMAFLGEMGGISKKNGTVEWLDKWKCWVCWCLHPASVTHNPNNREMFQMGIKNFAETLKKLGGIDEILF
jgi:DNA polymerase-3 subunit alpha